MKPIRRLLLSFHFATEGLLDACRREQNLRIHLLAAAVVTTAGVVTGLEAWEWIVLVLLIAGMISLELINSAIERAVDLATLEIHPLAKQAKDTAAAAVLVFAFASALIGLIIFLPKWLAEGVPT